MKMSEVDLLIESTITEAPVGMLKRGALKVASKLGSQKAAGQEVTADIANQLKKEYSRYLGLTGYDQDKESLEAFLNSKGLSSDSLDTAISTATGTGPTGQDWRIDTGPRTGATNQKVEPVVDIGSATDEVPSLDGESPIEKARAKRIAAQQKAVQQLRGQQPQEPVTKQDRLAGMSKGYVPPSEPTAQEPEVAQQEPSATGTQAASALSRLRTPQSPTAGRTSLVQKMKGQEPEMSDDEFFSTGDDIASDEEPVSPRQRPGISARAAKAGISQPKVPQYTSASAMSKATAAKQAELDTKLQAIDDAKAALASNPKDKKLKSALKKAEADYDSFVSDEIKPTDLKDKLATKVDQIKSGEEPATQMELPTEEPIDTKEAEKAQAAVEKAKTEYKKVKNKAGIPKSTKTKKLKDLNDANAELAAVTGTEPEVVAEPEPVSMQSPVTAIKPEKEEPVAKPEPKAEPKAEPVATGRTRLTDREISNLQLPIETSEITGILNDLKSRKKDKGSDTGSIDLAIKALDEFKKVFIEYQPIATRIQDLGEKIDRINNKTKTTDKDKADLRAAKAEMDAARDEYAIHIPELQRLYANYINNDPKFMLAASVEHEFDYLLAEAAFTNKQIDKIILAVTQDNIRKGIISIPGVPKPKDKGAKPTAQPSQYARGGETTGAFGGQQYAPQTPKAGAKTLDLSDLNVERLISAINHILKKEELQRYEENQLKKLMQELKAVKEGRDLLANSLTEAPMGFGQRLATGVASKFSQQAAGKLDVGKIANQYKPEYSRWLGTTGANPDAQSLIDFFQSKRLDTSKVQAISDSVAPNATRLTSGQLDTIIMQVTQDNIRKGVITPAAAAQASGQPTQQSQSTIPVMAQRMMNDPTIQSHPEWVRFLSGLK